MYGLNRFEFLSLTIATIQLLTLVPTLLFAAFQMRRQRMAVVYDTYQRLVDVNFEHVRLTMENLVLDSIWEPWPEDKKLQLDLAQEETMWGAWLQMDEDERRCYHFTWMRIQLHEQQWQLHRRGAIDRETWSKWSSWGLLLASTRYFRYVMADCASLLLPEFVSHMKESKVDF